MIISHRAAQLQFCAPPGAQTLAGFRQWALSDEYPETGKISLVGGHLLVDMNPERFQSQNRVKVIFTRLIVEARHRELLCEVFVWSKEGYVAVEPRDGWFASTVFEREFRPSRERKRNRTWRYALESRKPGWLQRQQRLEIQKAEPRAAAPAS